MKDKHFLRIKYVLLFVFMIALITVRIQQDKRPSNSALEELLEALNPMENLIDYSRDGATVYALISQSGCTEYGDFVVVYRQTENGSWERKYENDFSNLKPWKIETADIDGDGEKEILIAVIKTTHFDETEKNRMFIFNYNGEKLYKKWTGSQIAGVWKDFFVGDLVSIPGEELIFIEKTFDEKEQISIYYWFDFGFFLLAESKSLHNIQDVSILGENRIQITYNENQKQGTLILMIKNGKMIETKTGR